jgi:hypothetical protein
MELHWIRTGTTLYTIFGGAEIVIRYSMDLLHYFVHINGRKVSTGFNYPMDAMKWIEGMIVL